MLKVLIQDSRFQIIYSKF